MIQPPLPRGGKKFILDFFRALALALLVNVLSELLTSSDFQEFLLKILNALF